MPDSSWRSSGRLVFASFIGVALACALGYFILKDMDQNQRIQSMQDTITTLQSSLAKKEEELTIARLNARHREMVTRTTGVDENSDGGIREYTGHAPLVAADAPRSSQMLKDLDSVSDTDSRSYSEKLQDFLSSNPSEEKAAVASRFIFDKARDQQGLPDYALHSIYASQTNADLKRVIAQVLSQRGNGALLNNQIAEAQARLKSEQPRERLEALGHLGKTRTTNAVDAIAPFLQDPDTTVRLAALFALRDTGNQQHAELVESMVDDPDPSVSTLAQDVLSSLKNLSPSARTTYSRSDIEAELPPIANP